MAFRDYVGDRQTVAAVALGDLSNEAQMASDELMRGVAITVLAPVLGQQVFFLPVQHREPPDFLKIMTDAGFARKGRPGGGAGHFQRPPISFETKVSGTEPVVKVISKHYYILKRRSCQGAKRRSSCCW